MTKELEDDYVKSCSSPSDSNYDERADDSVGSERRVNETQEEEKMGPEGSPKKKNGVIGFFKSLFSEEALGTTGQK